MKKATLIIILISHIFFATLAVAKNYYVWGGVGSNNNNGGAMTADSAWATLWHADSLVSPGDTVYIKGTFTGQQTLRNGGSHSGSATDTPDQWTSPVTYVVYDDNNVNFTGGYDNIKFSGSSYIIFNGFYGSTRRVRLYGCTGISAFVSGADHTQITGLIFGPSGQTIPNDAAILARGMSTYLYINDNLFDTGVRRESVYLGKYDAASCPPCYDEADYVYIYDNTFNLFASGADNNAFDTKSLAGVNEIKFYNNTITSNMNSDYGPFSLGGDAEIYGNTIDISGQTGNGWQVFRFWEGQSESGVAADVYIYRNTIIGADSRYVIGFTSTNYNELNLRFYNNIVKGFTDKGFVYCEGSSDAPGAFHVYHNTFHGNSNMDFDDGSCDLSFTVNVKNNIWDTWGAYAVMDGSNQTSTWDGNYYYKSGVTSSDKNFTWNGTARSFDYIVSTDSQEANGIFGTDPNLDANGKLQSVLPVHVDLSVEMLNWPNYNLDIDGKVRLGLWDIGASQYVNGVGDDDQPPDAPQNVKVAKN